MTNEIIKTPPKKAEGEDFLSHCNRILIKEFDGESDRACVIVSAALLDKALVGILKAYLLPISSKEDNLLEEIYAPISTFSARIDLCHRLGLISTQFCRDLHIMRKIRNDFAHKVSECSFDETSIRDRIEELMRSSGIKKRNPKLLEIIHQSSYKGPKVDFYVSILLMRGNLGMLLDKIESVKPAELEITYTMSEND